LVIFAVLFALLVSMGIVYFSFIKKSSKQIEKKAIDEKREKINTTQSKLPFKLIRNGVVKLKDRTFIKVLKVQSINTQLMEETEKETVKEIWSDILNSINYNIQIYKQSRIVQIDDYLDNISEMFSTEKSEDKRKALDIYHRFLSLLVQENSLKTKDDYIVITYCESEKKKKNRIDEVDETRGYRRKDKQPGEREGSENSSSVEMINKRAEFEQAKKILQERASSLEKTLGRLNISSRELNDEELLRLFYSVYNKERSSTQSLTNTTPSELTSLYVKERGGS